MRILHLIYDHMNNPWVGGGGAVRVYEIYKRLAKYGHEITIVSGKYPDASDYSEAKLNYKFIGTDRNYALSTLSYAFQAARFVKNYGNEFEIIIEDFAPWNPIFSRFLTKIPVILHINHREGKNILKRWFIFGIPFFLIDVFYPRFFSHVTALSEWTKKKINISHAVVVPAGINSNLFKDGKHKGGKDEKQDYILYIGRFHIKNKGLDTLISAMKGLDAKLMLVGRGRDENRLKEMTRKLKLNNIGFLGFINEDKKIRVLEGARLFVLPSRYEGQGIVVLEAAACGKPVIVSDIPELRYAVDAGFGLAFKTGDAIDLAEKMKLLLEDESLREELGKRAREYAKNYTWDKIAEEYERCLVEVVAR